MLLRLCFCAVLVGISAASATIGARSFPPHKIITTDVAIIGGGASGTYAAVRLREDFNTSVIVIEPQTELGGNVETYTLPGTDTTIEYGVQSYIRYGHALDFFARFGVGIAPFSSRRLTTINVDIDTGKALPEYIPPSSNATTEAFKKWLAIVEKYNTFVEPGYWNFPAPDAIPADFLTPFGEFAKKHGLEAAAPRIMAVSNVGVGGLKDVLTLYVIQAFGLPITQGLLDSSLFIPAGSNSLIYQRAYDLLKEGVYLESYVEKAERTDKGVRLVVRNGKKGDEILVNAKRILFTARPSKENLEPFDMDKQETGVFDRFEATWGSFVGVVKIPCIPENYSISYISSNAVPDDHLSLRDGTSTLRFDSTGPNGLGLFRVLFSTTYAIKDDEAKQAIVENVHKLIGAGTLNATECPIEYRAFVNHNGVQWPQSAGPLKDGFVQHLNALQGHRSTWWTGGRWSADYSSNVWAFTDTVLPRLLKDITEQVR